MKRKGYMEIIEETPLINHVESTITTGDPDYPGTTLEISDPNGKIHLFHVVVDSTGQKQIVFFERKDRYRLPLFVLEEIIEQAKEYVKYIEYEDKDSE